MNGAERIRALEDLLVEWVLALDDISTGCYRLEDDGFVEVDSGALLAFVVYGQRAWLAQLRTLGIEPMAAIAWSQ